MRTLHREGAYRGLLHISSSDGRPLSKYIIGEALVRPSYAATCAILQ
jgi:hypothetical protein